MDRRDKRCVGTYEMAVVESGKGGLDQEGEQQWWAWRESQGFDIY